MTVVLGLLAAVFYGVGDFAGGWSSRRFGPVTVLLWSYPIGAVLMAAMLPLFPGAIDGRVVLFGVLGGLAGLLGVIVLYGLMTVAPINVVSPVTAVLAAVVPVAVGFALGQHPGLLTWLGIVLGLGAVVLVSRTREDHPHGRVGPRVLALAMLAGLGFGLYFVFLARAGNDSGLWPLVISRVASAVIIVPIARSRGAITLIDRATAPVVLLAGVCDALANMLFLLASREGLLAVASVLTSLYPATTVVLASWLLKERTSGVQRAGLLLAAAAIVLITV